MNMIPMPRLMPLKASIPDWAAAVGAITVPDLARIQVSMNCISVYDAICATVGPASASSNPSD